MKKIRLLPAMALSLCLLAGCARTVCETAPPDAAPAAGINAMNLEPDETPTYLTCRIVDGAEDGTLLLAELDEALYGGHDGMHGGKSVYRLTVTEDMAVTLDGAAATAADLEDGMPVEIAFDGAIEDSFPGRLGQVWSINAYSIGTWQNPGGSYYDLCGLYLQVLEDLWNTDSGLNGGVEVIGLDLSQAPGGLTDSEKAAIAWRFGELHGAEVVSGTYDQLVEQGYITSTAISTPAPEEGQDSRAIWYEWKDGIFFSIEPNSDHERETYSLPVLFFNTEKWRTSLGAYYFRDCSCVWPEKGAWNGYGVGAEMIS